MTVPYNTGKVKIGHAYAPPMRRVMSRDEERLQRTLIGDGLDEPIRVSKTVAAYCATVGILMATLMLLLGG